MNIQPVRGTVNPRYPSSDYLEQHPDLLSLVPERWRQNAFVLRVLGGVVGLVLAAQNSASAQQRTPGPPSRVAPIFVHGSGRGAFGCIAVSAPVFLTEDEARQVIQQEAKTAGLEFEPGALTLHGVDVPVTELYSCFDVDGMRKPPAPAVEKRDLPLDGFDRKHNVAFEFVSGQDYAAWQTKRPQCVSSVSVYEVKDAAARLRDGLATTPRGPWLGLFYEPAAGTVAARQQNGEELRKQVRDFLQWLKAQGVL
jgi:hypothetical protein